MDLPLLASKTGIPLPRAGLIRRPQLVARLNEGLIYPVTLVAAPAGFGKTTALSMWAAQSEAPVAWLLRA